MPLEFIVGPLEIQGGIRSSRPKEDVNDKNASERQRKIEKMRNSKEYQNMLLKNIKWLQQLDATDSNPNNGRLDVSVFNAKVSQFGYEATPDIVGHSRHGMHAAIYSKDVDIQKQAGSMTDKYYSKQFGL